MQLAAGEEASRFELVTFDQVAVFAVAKGTEEPVLFEQLLPGPAYLCIVFPLCAL